MYAGHSCIRFLVCFLLNVLSVVSVTQHRVLDGSLTIAGLFELQTVGSDGKCGEVHEASVMTMEAVRWYIQSFNENKSLPLQIGFSVYKTCGNLGHAGDAAVDIISRYRGCLPANATDDIIIGVIGPEFSSETRVVSSVLGSQTTSERFLQIGFSATSSALNDRANYPNFYRVVVEDQVQIMAMLQLMFDLQWNRIAVMYINDTYGRGGASMLQDNAAAFHICISKMDAIEIDSSRHVEVSKIQEILNNYILKAPIIEGVVYFGTESVANKVMQIFDSLQTSDVPVFILSESNLETGVFESATGNVLSKTKGALGLSLPFVEATDFKLYWESLFTNKTTLQIASAVNPYLKDVFKHYKRCDFDSQTCGALNEEEIKEQIQQSVYVHYAVLAVHTLTEALTKFYDTTCHGGCKTINEFREKFTPNTLLEAMDGLTVSYKGVQASFIGSSPNVQLAEGEKEYEVYNFRKGLDDENEFQFVNVGYLARGDLILDTAKLKDYSSDGSERQYPDIRRGQCPVGYKCSECIDNDKSEISYHIPGDFYVVGIISINNRAIPGPVGCGAVRTRHGYQMYLSLQFALQEFQTGSWYAHYKDKFAGKSIGLIVINSCNNALEVVPRILELHAKGLLLPDGSRLDLTNRILGYIGGQAADVSEPAAMQLTKLKFVQISYSSTNPVLSNKQLYPYFLRIISPDNVQATAMIAVVKELGGEYIQLVYSEGAYGEGGRDAVLDAAADAKICVVQTIMVKEKDTYFDTYEIMRRKPHAKIVIVFLRSHIVGPFLRDLNEDLIRGQFQFIGSEAWGKNLDVLDYDITKGAIITAVEMDRYRELEQFIKVQTVEYNETNPWLEDYVQNRQDCYYSWSYDKTLETECTDDILPPSDPNFESDPWCIFVANTMLAFLKGAADFYSSQCGSSASSQLCADFVEQPEEFFSVLQNVKMDIYGTGDILIFDENGDGLMGYQIYNIQGGPVDKTAKIYFPIGSYNPTTGLQFEHNRLQYPQDEPIRSSCPSEGACSDCSSGVPTGDISCVTEGGQSAAVPVLGALIGVLAIAVVILSVLLWLKTRPKPVETYLTPTYSAKEEKRERERCRNANDGYTQPDL